MFTETKELLSQLQSRMNQLEEQHKLKDIQLNEATKMIQKLESENEDLKYDFLKQCVCFWKLSLWVVSVIDFRWEPNAIVIM